MFQNHNRLIHAPGDAHYTALYHGVDDASFTAFSAGAEVRADADHWNALGVGEADLPCRAVVYLRSVQKSDNGFAGEQGFAVDLYRSTKLCRLAGNSFYNFLIALT